MPPIALKSDKVARYRNEINRASTRLSVGETRIILSAIAQAGIGKVSDKNIYYVTADDLVEIGGSRKSSYAQMAEAAETLFSRSITIMEDGRREKFRWVQRVVFTVGSGRIGIQFSEPLIPYISDLRSGFTRLPLGEIADLKTAYSIRLYCMFQQYVSSGEFFVRVDDLRTRLEIDKKFALYGDLKRRILVPSLKDINEADSSSITVTMNERKNKRKVEVLEFYIQPKQTPDQTVCTQPPALTPRQIAMFADMLSGNNRRAMEKHPNYNITQFSDCCSRLGCGLQGLSAEQAAIKLRGFLQKPDFVAGVLPFLILMGYKLPGTRKPGRRNEKKGEPKDVQDVQAIEKFELTAETAKGAAESR